MTNNNWRERFEAAITRYVEQSGQSLGQVSEAAGLGRTYLSNMLKTGNMPKVDTFLAVCEAINVSPTYILLGIQISAEEERFFRVFASLSPDQKDIFLRFVESMGDRTS